MLLLGLILAATIVAAVVIHQFKKSTIDRRHVLLAAAGGAVFIIPQVDLSQSETARLKQIFEESGKTVVVSPADPGVLKSAEPPTDEDLRLVAEVKQELEMRRYFVDEPAGVDLAKKAGDRPVVQVLGINAALERQTTPR